MAAPSTPLRAPFGAGRVLRFWAPLAATWLMMAVEGPFLAALIARLAEPEYNLAAFGVALSIALLLEAPVIMLLAAGTALARDRASLAKLRTFTWWLNGALTALAAALLVPPVFEWVAFGVMDLPPPVAKLTRGALALLLPWPAAIGYRRLYQGLLIRAGHTRRVGAGTAIRLAAMAAAALGLFRMGVAGAHLAGAALSAGVLVEAVACRWMCRGPLRALAAERPGPPLGYREITAFYYPLALSSVLTLGVHPIVSTFLAQGRAPVESLAAFPVIRSLVFVFSCLGLSYQEVGIALLGERGEGYRPLRRFALGLGLASGAGLALVAFTPLGTVWYRTVSGLSAELAAFCPVPTRILALVPLLTVFLSFQRSVFVAARRTGAVTAATAVDVGAITAVLYWGTRHLPVPAIQVAAVALVAGRSAGNLLLRLTRGKVLRALVDRGGG